MNQTVYLILRMAIGASMFGHGLVRLPKLKAFSSWMVGSFEKSIMPHVMVVPFSYILPITEFIVGLLLLLGLFSRQALIGGSVVMILLIIGTTLIENWEILPSQLLHIAFFAILLQFISANTFSIDAILKK